MEKLTELRDKIKNCRGCNLVVGTGINYGLTPSWEKLINSIISYILNAKLYHILETDRKAIEKLFEREDVYTKAKIIKKYLGKKEYIMLIRDEIYKNCHLYNKNISESLIPQIADFCDSGFVKSIISVNYDDYLETYLKMESKRAIKAIYNFNQIKSLSADTLPIYHIHGYIGRKQAFSELFSQDITFSIDEYFSLFNNPFVWQNITPIYNFMLYPTIFLGTSLSDINLMRIVELSEMDKKKSNAYWFKANKKEENPKAMSFLSQLKGINYINCGEPKIGINRYAMINKVLNELIKNLNSND